MLWLKKNEKYDFVPLAQEPTENWKSKFEFILLSLVLAISLAPL